MEVKVVSTETIKPLFPTPIHKRSYKLCLCDQLQLFFPTYIPLLSFYSSPNENPIKRSAQLKHSLSETLTYFYPFAGRIKDCFTIDCNDEGAIYMEAELESDMSSVLQEPEISRLQQLLPFDPYENIFKPVEPSAMVMVAVQVNYFACGGKVLMPNNVEASTSSSEMPAREQTVRRGPPGMPEGPPPTVKSVRGPLV